MQFFRNLPIQKKIGWLMLMTCGSALAVAGAAVLVIQLATFRQDFTQDIDVIGQIVCEQCAAAITLKDPRNTEIILRAVRARSLIVEAAVLLPDDSKFAGFGEEAEPTATPVADGIHFARGFLVLNRPIFHGADRVGTLRLVSDYQSGYRQSLRLYGTVLGVVLLLSVVLVLFLSQHLQSLITKPILDLAQTAQQIADKQDYSVRALKSGQDEVGQLTNAFNDMLAKIEREIQERKSTELELANEHELFDALLNNFPDVIYFKDLDSRFVRYSKSFQYLFKVPDLAMIRGKTDADFFTAAHARPSLEDEQTIIRTGKPIIGKLERETHLDGSVTWALSSKMPWRNKQGETIGTFGISKDVTHIKEVENKIESLHKELLLTSRQAGMAEVATGVLHNVGNVLNSVNVSASLLSERLGQFPTQNIIKAADLLRQHRAGLAAFLAEDPKGKVLIGYLETVAEHLANEQKEMIEEVQNLATNVEHIKEIVAMQQNYARLCGVVETLPAAELVEDAIRLNLGAFERHGVVLVRDFHEVPPVTVDKHKVLQILVNLLRNAKYAIDEQDPPKKQLTLRIEPHSADSIRISVCDNGIGIAPENLTRIFGHGFTTRRDGHGFGLHSGALAAKEMGGCLTAASEGLGAGATFCLELPVAQAEPEEEPQNEKGILHAEQLAPT
jgi:PAS domain S-box-containing protein